MRKVGIEDKSIESSGRGWQRNTDFVGKETPINAPKNSSYFGNPGKYPRPPRELLSQSASRLRRERTKAVQSSGGCLIEDPYRQRPPKPHR